MFVRVKKSYSGFGKCQRPLNMRTTSWWTVELDFSEAKLHCRYMDSVGKWITRRVTTTAGPLLVHPSGEGEVLD
jgi:hypothetical protein